MQDIPGYEDLYAITRDGRVWGKKRKHWLKFASDRAGYLRAAICKNGVMSRFYVHQLVARTYLPNVENLPQVNHKNNKKADNQVENLEWCDQWGNMKHAKENGLRPRGEQSWCAKLTDEVVIEMRGLYVRGSGKLGHKALAKRFGVSQHTAFFAITGRTWKHLESLKDSAHPI